MGYVYVEDGDEDKGVWEAGRRECMSDTLNGCLVVFLLEFTAGRGGVYEEAGNDVDDW